LDGRFGLSAGRPAVGGVLPPLRGLGGGVEGEDAGALLLGELELVGVAGAGADDFAAPRGTTPATWPDTKGFLGKATDPTTGLTIVGARQYDPTTGLFISIDPILDPTRQLSPG
jgi:RHS repeat-associated protein